MHTHPYAYKDVVKGAGTLAMRSLDPLNLESLSCSNPEKWPPIRVTKTSKGYIYYDGQHRIHVAKELKLETIQAECKVFNHINDLVEATFRANLTHGLQSSREPRADYCYWLSITYPDLTQPQIAARVGVTQSTVSRAIAQRKKQIQEATKEAIQQQIEDEPEEENELEAWTNDVIKRTRAFVKSVGKFSDTVKASDNYYSLVRNMQFELLRDPEDREILLFTGQLLIDTANRSKLTRKGVK